MLVQLDDLMTKPEVAAKLRVTQRSVARWARDGYHGIVLESVKIGKRTFFEKQSVQLFIERLKRVQANRLPH